MPQSAGYLAKLKQGGTSVAGVTQASDQDGIDQLDISALKDDDGFRRYIMGLRGVSLSFDMDVIYGDTQQDAIRSGYAARSNVTLSYLPDGTNGYSGSFKITSINTSTSVDGKATQSVSAVLNGALTAVP